jgi:hypothetical protein
LSGTNWRFLALAVNKKIKEKKKNKQNRRDIGVGIF